MTTSTLERPATFTRLDLMRTRPDFVLRLDTGGARRLLDEVKAGRVACCETECGWHVWRLERMGR